MCGFPHDFPGLKDTGKQVVLFCGSGLSARIVPLPGELFEEKRREAEAELGLSGQIPASVWNTKEAHEQLYYWAECVLDKLDKNKIKNPKLRLAIALGITINPRWYGENGIDFRGNEPRHRVISRMAKEGRWKSIWSFNWDCVLEKALESVGLPSNRPRFDTPWTTDHYCVHITNQQLQQAHRPKSVAIHKPHGCVTALRLAVSLEGIDKQRCQELSERFMIKKSELDDRSPPNKVDTSFFSHLDSEVSGHENLSVAWSIGEKSLRSRLINALKSGANVRLSVVDLKFSNNHNDVCKAANQNKTNSFFKVKETGCPTTDDLFRWIQAQYALDQLAHEGGESVDSTGTKWRDSLDVCLNPSFIIDWVDEFLPTWTRLCWSAGLIKCYDINGVRFPPHKIDLERRDEHIPLHVANTSRPDLVTAKNILSALPAKGGPWDACRFPGGLFNGKSGCLVIPLPVWKRYNELRALKPLVAAIKGNLWMVSKIRVYPVGLSVAGYDPSIADEVLHRLADFMRVPEFAKPGSIKKVTDLNDGDCNGKTH